MQLLCHGNPFQEDPYTLFWSKSEDHMKRLYYLCIANTHILYLCHCHSDTVHQESIQKYYAFTYFVMIQPYSKMKSILHTMPDIVNVKKFHLLVMSSDVLQTPGIHIKSFNICSIIPENSVLHSQSPSGAFWQTPGRLPCEKPPCGNSTIQAYRGGCPAKL